jgi:uncharacterized membrane protein YfcA
MRYAMGAALCSVIATSCGAAAAYLRDGISNMRIGLFLSVATTIGAVCRALMATVLDQSVLSIIFGVTLLATVGLSLTKKQESPLLPKDSDPLALRLVAWRGRSSTWRRRPWWARSSRTWACPTRGTLRGRPHRRPTCPLPPPPIRNPVQSRRRTLPRQDAS